MNPYILAAMYIAQQPSSNKQIIKHDRVLKCALFRTQPETLFHEDSEEDEEADKEPEWKKRKI